MDSSWPPKGPRVLLIKPSSAQRSQHLMEIRFRNLLSRGDLLAVHGTLAGPQGELKERPDAVVRAT